MKKGYTLIELLAVMVAMFTIMGVSVVLMVQVFDFRQTNNRYSDGVRATDRFVAEFRDDVHTYGKPEIPAEGDTLLRFRTETATVDYVTEPGVFPNQQTIIRTEQKDGRELKETYRLPDRTTLWFVNGKDADAGLVALSLWTAPPETEMPKPDDLNPFDRISNVVSVDSKYAGNWRTIIVRYEK